MIPAGARARPGAFFGQGCFFAMMALVLVVVASGGAACGPGDGVSEAPGPGPSSDAGRAKQTVGEEGDDVPGEGILAHGGTPEHTSPETASPSTTGSVSASTGAGDRPSEQDVWAEQAGYHYRASLDALEDALRRLDPSREVTDEDFSAIAQDEFALRAADQGFRSIDPPPELGEANGHLLEASAGLSDLSYELTEAANSFYPSERLDDVAEEIALVLEELDAADAAAREQGIGLDPRSEAPTPEEVGALFVRLGAESEALERHDTPPEQTGCSEEDPCPI